MNEAYICLGGNQGNCIEAFEKAVSSLQKGDVSVLKRSSIYQTQAWGMENTPDFHNLVIAVNTGLSGQQLMKFLLEIEKIMGRERDNSNTYQSRPIDMDILFFNTDLIHTKELTVPHPRLHLRRFVLEPMNEIAPDFVHPVFKKTISQLLKECPDKSAIKKSDHVF